MIDVFLITSGDRNANQEKTIKSLGDIQHTVNHVEFTNDINDHKKENDWFFILYDNEVLSEELSEALPIFFANSDKKVLVCYQKIKNTFNDETKMYRVPRAFRKGIKLQEDSLMPKNVELTRECHILNGGIEAFVYNQLQETE